MIYIILIIIFVFGLLLMHIADKKGNDVIGITSVVILFLSGLTIIVLGIWDVISNVETSHEKLNSDRENSISKELNIPKEQIRFESEYRDSINAISLKGDYYVQFKQKTATIVKIEELKNKSEEE
ncbi:MULTISPECIES: hypothetical protein [Bacillus]|uniref:Uncharacterized protein n=1 Tax=Bacillus cereus TaxID=1396 RepID=A0A9X0MK36_BACCE|nr:MULTISPECIES: hypothetical protein [Bacillus cereus group]PEZ75407.1 hypothetical protein CN410_15215 [Bacillus anthracis]KXY51256.1 hypothetical protein AT268_32740 [Bacillus cereus]PFA29596.1 hypothetical protein CN384_07855 [Bacillus thuringiensis]PFQ36556.1 hypothetical protein COK33_17490 [Bacillus cereus]PGB07079.1 hypothetical protein COM09_31645 [Bacillus toyonensis]